MKKTILWILVMILLISSVQGIGVAPAKSLIDYEPGKILTKTIKVVNTGPEMNVIVYAEGPLAEYISFEKSVYPVQANSELPIKYTLRQPSSLEPGTQSGKIYIIELPKEKQVVVVGEEVKIIEDGTQVSATTGVTHDVHVKVPFPGKYVQGNLFVNNANPGEPLVFTVGLTNVGKDSIEKVSARIKIFGATYEEIAEVRTDEVSLGIGAQGRIVASYPEFLHPGLYKATAYLDYGERIVTIDHNFAVGDRVVKIKELEVNDFRLGAIGKLDVLVENNWNEDIKGVVGEFEVIQKGEVISEMKSPPADVPALGEAVISGYWDTAGLDIGEYDINVKIGSEKSLSERLFPTYVGADQVTVKDTLTGRATGVDPEGSKFSLLIILIGGLVILNIVGLVLFFRNRRKPPNTYNVSRGGFK